jgi:two-component system, chemotaxis family, chemotaxis protein CheY
LAGRKLGAAAFEMVNPRQRKMSMKVLVIDDSVTIRQMVTFTLTEAGFEPIESTNGQEGLEQLKGHPVDLIITDLNMPVMDGLTFIRAARSIEDYKFTPILVLTTESQEEVKTKGKAAGATGWLVKPFNPETLLRVIAKVVA